MPRLLGDPHTGRKSAANSICPRAALAFALNGTPTLDLRLSELSDLRLYNEDLELATPPDSWLSHRSEIPAA